MSEIRIGEPNGPLEPMPEGEQEPDPPNLRLLLRELVRHLGDLDGEIQTQDTQDRNGALRRAVRRYLDALEAD